MLLAQYIHTALLLNVTFYLFIYLFASLSVNHLFFLLTLSLLTFPASPLQYIARILLTVSLKPGYIHFPTR